MKILITDIFLPPIDTKNGLVPKDKALLDWFIKLVGEGLAGGIFKAGDFIPSKKELAQFHNVSTGTVQNAVRYAEDLGLFVSRQCVGTMISGGKTPQKPKSKKDVTVEEIKKFIVTNKMNKGEILPGARNLALETNSSQNTVRLALEVLVQKGILNNAHKNSNLQHKILNVNYTELETGSHFKNETLSKNLYSKIKDYIVKNYAIGDRIMSNEEFAKMFNVSIRTVNTATKRLNKEKIILSLRGKYGTRYVNEPDRLSKKGESERSKFMSSPKAENKIKKSYSYNWQRVLDLIKKYMIQNHEAGDKLPSMKNLATAFEVSTNTVRKAVRELCAQGILFCQRGKSGGIFIVEMPQKEDSYQWLALNPKYLEGS